jgi:protocatechuate 4,5-dioxygenase beta chain
MPIVVGAGVSYSPLLYRKRAAWPAVSESLRGSATQPQAAVGEVAQVLDGYESRITSGLDTLARVIAQADLAALIVVTADRGSQFDSSHVPQIHVQSGGEIWGDPAIRAIGEPPARATFECERAVAAMLAEELVRSGFDLAEAKDAFDPVGRPDVGVTPAVSEALVRLGAGLPIIPISLNCHVPPLMSGHRFHQFGRALGRAAALTDKRLGVLVSGGLSGEPGGERAGWIDDVFDRWALARLERGCSADLARVWEVPSRNLLLGTAEWRLWTAAAAALEQAGCRAQVHDYLPIHHAATGVAFVSWEN